MNCAEFHERIVEIAEGASPLPEEVSHLGACRPCRAAIDRSRQISKELSSLALLDLPPGAYEAHLGRRVGARRRLWLRLSAVAAVLLAAVTAAIFAVPSHPRMEISVHDVDRGSGLVGEDAWVKTIVPRSD